MLTLTAWAMIVPLHPASGQSSHLTNCNEISASLNIKWTLNRDIDARLHQIERELLDKEVEAARAVVLLEQRADFLERFGISFRDIANAMKLLNKKQCPQGMWSLDEIQQTLKAVERSASTFSRSAKSSRRSARDIRASIAKGYKGTVTIKKGAMKYPMFTMQVAL